MDARISQETRQTAAQQLRQWASTRNVPLAQIEQMVTAVLSGQHDAQILQAMPSGQNNNPSTQQQNIFIGPNPPFTFQTPFGTVPFPSIPPMPIPTASNMCPPPASMVPNMFPNMAGQNSFQAPVSESTRTIFPGGEAVQQSSSYSGQQGNTTFRYNSSSTSMTFTPEVQLPFRPPWSIPFQQLQQPGIPMMPSTSQQPMYIPQATMPLLTMPQPTLHYQPPQPSNSYIEPQNSFQDLAPDFPAPILEVPAPPEPVFNPAAADQAPQNPRLAGRLKQKLDEATYFSDVPGMPDRSVQR